MARLTEMEESLRESKMSCDLLTEDKDRFLKEAVKLTRQVQAMSFEADDVHRVRGFVDRRLLDRDGAMNRDGWINGCVRGKG